VGKAARLLDLVREPEEVLLPVAPKPLAFTGEVSRTERTEHNMVVCVHEPTDRKQVLNKEITINRSMGIEPDHGSLSGQRVWQTAMSKLAPISKHRAECLTVSSRDIAECSGDVNLLRKRSSARLSGNSRIEHPLPKATFLWRR